MDYNVIKKAIHIQGADVTWFCSRTMVSRPKNFFPLFELPWKQFNQTVIIAHQGTADFVKNQV